jgi:sugar phosphate isomerase/epimerase
MIVDRRLGAGPPTLGSDGAPEGGGLVDVSGLLEIRPVEDVANRNYVAVGCGRDLQWWKEPFSVVRMMGYNEWVSLKMEDLTMSVEAGIKTSIEALKQTISQ